MNDSHWRRWGAIYILVVLFVASWVGQFVAQAVVVADEAAQHGQPFSWAEFWPQFAASTLENWQSEYLQLLVQAVLIVALADRLFRRGQEDQLRLESKVDQLLGRAHERG